MARILVLFLLISLFASTLALRGQSSNSVRRLVEDKAEDEDYVGAKEKHKSKKKSSKKSKSKSKKHGKKDGKKCKKAKKAKKEKGEKTMAAEASQEGAEIDDVGIEDSSGVEEAMHYCLHGDLSAEECAAVKSGDLPKEGTKVKGTLEMDIAFEDDPKQAKRMLEEVLRSETPAKFVGCDKRRVRFLVGDADTEEEESTESSLSVTGVDFDQVEISKQGMAKTKANIYYEGKGDVSDEESQEMFDLLAETILVQASTGSFSEVGELRSVQASSSPTEGGSSGAGMPVGVAVSAVVAVGALVGLVYYKRKAVTAADDKDESHADTSDDESVIHAHAVLVDDEKKEKKKEDTQEVEATLVSIPDK